jgi:hypothetical protein
MGRWPILAGAGRMKFSLLQNFTSKRQETEILRQIEVSVQ